MENHFNHPWATIGRNGHPFILGEAAWLTHSDPLSLACKRFAPGVGLSVFIAENRRGTESFRAGEHP
jgi:hypothetical protein